MNDDNEYELPPEEQVSFVGSCTCDHDEEEHGWTACDVDRCNCEAHWEE